MKNLLKKSLLLAFVVTLGSFTTFASTEKGKKKVPTKFVYSINPVLNSNKIALGVKKDQPGRLAVKIYDEQGNHIHTDQFAETNGFYRTYDLSNTGAGKYTVKIFSEDEVGTEKVIVGKTIKKEAFRAYFVSKNKNNKFQVSYYNAHSPARVLVYNDNNQLVSNEMISPKKDHSAIINLSKLHKGNYTVRIESEGNGIEKTIQVVK